MFQPFPETFLPMTVPLWSPPESRRPRDLTAKPVVDRLPEAVLDKLAEDIPGPKHETVAGRADRIAMRRTEILSYRPRDTAEAMLATQCIILGMLMAYALGDTAIFPPTSSIGKKTDRDIRFLYRNIKGLPRCMLERRTHLMAETNRVTLEACRLSQPPIPEPNDRALAEEAFSAVIVPVHPAPKMLQ
jgi:hypothetical protein